MRRGDPGLAPAAGQYGGMGTDEQQFRFDVAVSFAGEDREYVGEVVAMLRDKATIFFDEDYEVEAWGQDGIEYFTDVYQNRARYAVIFVSRSYAEKVWTRTERRAALARAARQRSEYVLPIRLDDTELDGLLPTTIYLDARRYGTQGLVDAIRQKIALNGPPPKPTVNSVRTVPRTPEEIQRVLAEREGPWEYLLYAGLLYSFTADMEPKYNDFKMGYARRSTTHVSVEDLTLCVRREVGAIHRIIANFEAVLTPSAQEDAFGKPGQPGDANKISHLASRFASNYEDLMDWSGELRGMTAEREGDVALKLLARWAEQPVRECRRFVQELVTQLDKWHEPREDGTPISIDITASFNLDSDLVDAMMTKVREVVEGA